MRWVSSNPEFSWAGTITILAAFSAFAAAQSTAAVVRLRATRPGTIAVARAFAAVVSLGLFGGAGAFMLPTVLFGSIAVWRNGARWIVRALCAVLALPSVGVVVLEVADDGGWTVGTIGRLLVFVAIYAAIIAATWPAMARVADGWKPTRRLVVIVVSSIAGLFGLALYFGGVQ
jgi:hypothetical protein